MAIVAITLDDKQKMWVEQIVMDEDKDEALKFLKECIYEKLKGQGEDLCGPASGGGETDIGRGSCCGPGGSCCR